MGFFGRLTNLGKGWVSGLGKKSDTDIVDVELEADRLNPRPGPEAEAQLATLKGTGGKTQPTDGTGGSRPSDIAPNPLQEEPKGDPSETTPSVKKTL